MMRDLGVEGVYYGGYGYATFHFAEAFKALDWDPPRVMGTAFMFYSNSNKWAEGLEGWHGVDQLGEDGANPNYNAMIERMREALRARRPATSWSPSPTTPPGSPSTASATPSIPAPLQVKEGMERIRWMPATNGGPGTYIQFGPHDRKGYKGDFLTIRELRGGELRFDGYHRPAVALQPGPPLGRLGAAAGLHPRVHRHHRAQPRPLHAPHDGQLVPGRPRRAQPAVPRRVGHPRVDRALARGREHVGARRLGRPRRQLRPRDRRREGPGPVAGRVVGDRRLAPPRRRRPHRRARAVDPPGRRS